MSYVCPHCKTQYEIYNNFVRHSQYCPPSPESGDRRQDAANDHGSEPENDLREAEAIAEMWNKGNHVAAAMYLRSLIGEVSARSADAYEVLGMAISQTREIIIGIDEQLNSEDGGSVYDDDMLEDLRGAYASSISHFRRAQNLLKKPGLG